MPEICGVFTSKLCDEVVLKVKKKTFRGLRESKTKQLTPRGEVSIRKWFVFSLPLEFIKGDYYAETD